ncbi:MAG: amino acid ABC transporter ATP-binding protein [Rhodospirillales bacterium]|nr:amino acid ABC transporter ATP-binding protein [Rhodospirillales bacterium]
MTDLTLRLEGICKSFGSLSVLKDVDLDVNKGETKVLMGPSGTGKSTLLRCINLLDPPDTGRIWLDGREITAKGINVDEVRSSIGMVFQDFNLFTHLTALDNVRIGLVRVKGVDKKTATDMAMEELRRVDLAEKAASYPAQLSGGQQQRVSIARALALKPRLILFDEPTSALDPELTGEVLKVMSRLAEDGMTMVIASHEIDFARSAADEIVFMADGRIVEKGPPDVMFTSPQQVRTRDFFRRIGERH